MFTGIIEGLGMVEGVEREGGNVHFWFSAPFTTDLKIDQSVAHDGVCLTVVDIDQNRYKVTAIAETLSKTNLSDWKQGRVVNLERCLLASSRFDGHVVQGHVDQLARVTKIEDADGSWRFYFKFESQPLGLVVSKGSIAINGVSLTVVESTDNVFSVAIIPYTLEHTGFKNMSVGDLVNIEFDVVGKYVFEAQRRLNQL